MKEKCRVCSKQQQQQQNRRVDDNGTKVVEEDEVEGTTTIDVDHRHVKSNQ